MNAQEHQRIDDRLRNWARYVWDDYGMKRRTCASAERYYVAPRPDDEAQQRHSTIPVDVIDAEKVERAVCRLVYERDRWFLRKVYCESVDKRVVCRKMRLHWDLFDAFKLRVLGLVAACLADVEHAAMLARKRPVRAVIALREIMAYNSGQQLDTTSSE